MPGSDEFNGGDVPAQLEDVARRLEAIARSQETLATQQNTFSQQLAGFVGQITELARRVSEVHQDMRGAGQQGGMVARIALLERDCADLSGRLEGVERSRRDEASEGQKAKSSMVLWMIGLFITILFSASSLLVSIVRH